MKKHTSTTASLGSFLATFKNDEEDGLLHREPDKTGNKEEHCNQITGGRHGHYGVDGRARVLSGSKNCNREGMRIALGVTERFLHKIQRKLRTSQSMSPINQPAFRRRVDKAIETVRQVLQRARSPVYPAEAQHLYSDKFILANLLVRLALSNTLQALTILGMTEKKMGNLVEWSKDKTVSLRFVAKQDCVFVKEMVREREPATRTETVGHVGSLSYSASKNTVTRVTEYVWTITGKYELIAFRGLGAQAADQILITSREYSREIITGSKSQPPRVVCRPNPISEDISWLLSHLAADRSITFEIKREVDTCRTPRRNRDVEEVIQQLGKLAVWASSVHDFFSSSLFPVAELGHSDQGKRPNLAGINTDGVFLPVVPLFIEESDAVPGSLTFKPSDVAQFLEESNRSLVHKISTVTGTLPSEGVVTGAEAQTCICLCHLSDVASALREGLDYVEHMLYTQLYAAVGRHITPNDFAAFNRFHNRQLFRDDMQPLPFCFAVRRSPRHSPEGTIAIESIMGGAESHVPEPVYTNVRGGKAGVPMHFHINAATRVQFKGERFLHAWLLHAFSGQGQVSAALTAQARQLSSFIVVIGRISSADAFEPKHAMIVQNKDEFRIPLHLESIPTPKEFKDAIESLSQEQQDFCRAWRAMQLESTLFAVAVIQIKPLLERVLNLPAESLSKEIKLTQDLTELFIKYQIPADLLTAGTVAAEAEAVAPPAKVAQVKGHVKAMHALLEGEKQKQSNDAAQTSVHDAVSGGRVSTVLISLVMDRELPELDALVEKCDSIQLDVSKNKKTKKKKKMEESDWSDAKKRTRKSSRPRTVTPEQEQGIHSPPQQHQDQLDAGTHARGGVGGEEAMEAVDYTTLPAILDGRLEALDASNAVRPTIISAGERWTKKAMASLMSREADTSSLGEEELRGEKTKAFELLDALTRSGALVVEEASLHVVLAATHTFDKSLVDTVVQDSVNPVVQVERSSLIMASSVMGLPAASLIRDEHRPRVQSVTPALFDDTIT